MPRTKFNWNSLLFEYELCQELSMLLDNTDISELVNLQKNIEFMELVNKKGINETKRLIIKAFKYRGIMLNKRGAYTK